MEARSILLSVALLAGVLLIAGCTAPSSPQAPAATTPAVPVTSPAPAVIPTTASAPMAAVTSAVTTTTAVTTATTLAPDPILHRWIRRFTVNQSDYGYEFKFFPDGTVSYDEGPTTEISSNIQIPDPVSEASGTWVSEGNNKYLVKILPTGQTGAPMVREYTLVPQNSPSNYPGLVIPAHIESSFEKNQIPKAREPMPDEMDYPEQATID